MLRKIFLIVAVLAVFSMAYTKNTEVKNHLGFRGAVSYNDYYNIPAQAEPILDGYMGFGFNAGIVGSIAFNDFISLNPALELSMRWGKSSFNYISYRETLDCELTLTQTDFEVPVLLQVNLSKIFGIELGPQMSINVSSDATLSAENNKKSGSIKMDFNPPSTEFGLVFGFADVGSFESVDIDVRAVLFLTEMSDQNESKVFQIQLGLTYYFLNL